MSLGICTSCGEWTELDESCCDAGVWIEGGIVYPEEGETCGFCNEPCGNEWCVTKRKEK